MKINPKILIDMLSGVKNMKCDSIKKVLFTVGGWQEESKHFSRMADSPNKRDNFYTSLIAFLFKWGFDGVQIDWRYPTQRGGQSEDRQNFVLLLEELGLM